MRANKQKILLLFVLVVGSMMVSSSFVHAILIDSGGIVHDELKEKIELLELQSRKTIVVGVIPASGQPFNDGVSLLQEYHADIVILYRYQENKLAIIQPIDGWIPDATIKAAIDGYENEKQRAATNEEKNAFLANIMGAISPLLIAAKDTRGYCSTVKDGYCDPKCESVDMDCLCGDAICQYHEVKATCSIDCGEVREQFCSVLRDGICDENCKRDIDCGFGKLSTAIEQLQKKTELKYSTILGVLYFLFLGASAIFAILLHQEQKQKSI